MNRYIVPPYCLLTLSLSAGTHKISSISLLINRLFASAVTADFEENRSGIEITIMIPENITAYRSKDANPLINAGIIYEIADIRP